MPRTPRRWSPDSGAHLISRFVDRRFHLADEVDRAHFLESVSRANGRWDWRWLSFALMSSHVHYGMVAGLQRPERFFRSAHTRYAKCFHMRRSDETLGPVFARRPSLHVVGFSGLERMVAYHHRNPVEAGVVDRARESRWTSHRAYLRLDPAPRWLDVEWALDLLGFPDTEAGRRQFDEFVMGVDLTDWRPHKDDAEPQIAPDPDPIRWERLVESARVVVGLSEGVCLQSRRRDATHARRLVCIVATHDHGRTYQEVAAHFGMTTGAAFNLVSRANEARIGADLARLRVQLGNE